MDQMQTSMTTISTNLKAIMHINTAWKEAVIRCVMAAWQKPLAELSHVFTSCVLELGIMGMMLAGWHKRQG